MRSHLKTPWKHTAPKIGQLIGKGRFSKVYVGVLKKSNEKFAIKVIEGCKIYLSNKYNRRFITNMTDHIYRLLTRKPSQWTQWREKLFEQRLRSWRWCTIRLLSGRDVCDCARPKWAKTACIMWNKLACAHAHTLECTMCTLQRATLASSLISFRYANF